MLDVYPELTTHFKDDIIGHKAVQELLIFLCELLPKEHIKL